MIPRMTPKVTDQLEAENTSYTTKMVSKWMLAYGIGTTGYRILDEIRAIDGNYRQKVQFRCAAVTPDLPDAWTLSANVHSNNGVVTEDFTPTASKMWIQAGISASVSSAVGEALVSLQASGKSNAEVVATGGFQVEPDLNSTTTAYYPIGEPFPAVGLAGLMYGVVVTGVNGTLTFRPAYRAVDRADDPGAWTDLASDETTTVNERYNSGDCTLTVTNMMVQAGIKVTTAARGTFSVLVAARY
jgi:hypothetical protein